MLGAAWLAAVVATDAILLRRNNQESVLQQIHRFQVHTPLVHPHPPQEDAARHESSGR